MKETDFYQRHVRKMSGVLHLERIENSVGSGFPDVSVAGGGKQFLIETKVAKLVDGEDYLYFERFQLPFYMKRLRYTEGKGVFVMALWNDDKTICVWNAQDILDAPREPYKKWNRVAVSSISGAIDTRSKPFSKLDMCSMAAKLINLS